MALKITKGPRKTAVRAVLYGTEGIGKSELATLLPRPLVLDAEGSTNQLDCERSDLTTWPETLGALATLGSTAHDYQTVVIDTADWIERFAIEDLLRRHGKKSIEDFGFGKGYTMLAEEFARIFPLCDAIIGKGVHVVFLAHAKVVRQSPPDQTDGFDRYELKLSKQCAPLLKEWSEMLLFANFRLQIVEGTDGKLKAQGGKERVLYTTHSAAWDAKNRYDLPESLPMPRGSLAPELAAVFAGERRSVAPFPIPATTVAPAPAASPAADNVPAPRAITADQLAKLTEYNKNSVAAPIIAKACDHYGAPMDLLTEEQAAKVIKRCQEEMNKPDAGRVSAHTPPPSTTVALPWPADVAEWLGANEKKVNDFLIRAKWLGCGQTWRELSAERAEKVILKPENFARGAEIPNLNQEVAA